MTMLAYVPIPPKTQFRSYSIPYEDKVAKFKGKKGSDVCAKYLHDLSMEKGCEKELHSSFCGSRVITQ